MGLWAGGSSTPTEQEVFKMTQALQAEEKIKKQAGMKERPLTDSDIMLQEEKKDAIARKVAEEKRKMARKDQRRAKKDQVKRSQRRAAAGNDQELTPEEMAEVLQKLKVGPATGMDKHWCTGLLGAGGLLGEQARRRVKGDPVHKEQWLAGIGMPDWQDCCYVAASLARVGAIDLFVPHLAMISKERTEAMQQSVNLGPTTMSRSQTIEARTGISLPLSAPRRTNAGGASCQSIVRMIQVLVENGGASEPVGRVQSTVLDADPALKRMLGGESPMFALQTEPDIFRVYRNPKDAKGRLQGFAAGLNRGSDPAIKGTQEEGDIQAKLTQHRDAKYEKLAREAREKLLMPKKASVRPKLTRAEAEQRKAKRKASLSKEALQAEEESKERSRQLPKCQALDCFLQELGLGHCFENMLDEGATAIDDLRLIDDEMDLIEMGFKEEEDRMALLEAIAIIRLTPKQELEARVLLVKTGVLTATSLLELKGMSMKDLRAKAFEAGLTESDLDDALDEATVSLTLPCRVSACAGSAVRSHESAPVCRQELKCRPKDMIMKAVMMREHEQLDAKAIAAFEAANNLRLPAPPEKEEPKTPHEVTDKIAGALRDMDHFALPRPSAPVPGERGGDDNSQDVN